MFDYNSPIEITLQDMDMQIEDNILNAVQRVNINVNKDELMKALSYDRQQYQKGYDDARNNIIHCKDCTHYSVNNVLIGNVCKRLPTVFNMQEDDFCSYAVRKVD